MIWGGYHTKKEIYIMIQSCSKTSHMRDQRGRHAYVDEADLVVSKGANGSTIFEGAQKFNSFKDGQMYHTWRADEPRPLPCETLQWAGNCCVSESFPSWTANILFTSAFKPSTIPLRRSSSGVTTRLFFKCSSSNCTGSIEGGL